ncbi:MAG: hypothetical protein KatS3mg060_1267 [Dehalococcoidia bacterium]|nr:MAG: hypothetical protein KatS3mg060_1267 [Dehalococcoidia bacterium]
MARSKRRRSAVNQSLIPPRTRSSRTLRYLYLAIIVSMVACLILTLLPQFTPVG